MGEKSLPATTTASSPSLLQPCSARSFCGGWPSRQVRVSRLYTCVLRVMAGTRRAADLGAAVVVRAPAHRHQLPAHPHQAVARPRPRQPHLPVTPRAPRQPAANHLHAVRWPGNLLIVQYNKTKYNLIIVDRVPPADHQTPVHHLRRGEAPPLLQVLQVQPGLVLGAVFITFTRLQ